MTVTRETLKAKYAQLSTDDLMQLYRDGELTEEAAAILVNEIGSRGCEIPTELEVCSHKTEKEKVAGRKRAATWSAITLCAFLFLYHFGGYELIRDEFFPQKASHAYIAEGLKFCKQGDHVKAIECFKKAREINPEDPVVYSSLGAAYMGLGRFKDAVSLFEKAIALKPDSAHAYSELAAAYDLLEDYHKAALCAEKSIHLFEQAGDERNAGKARLLLRQIYKDRHSPLQKYR